MKATDHNNFHKLYGIKKPRIIYHKKDFVDYVLMILVSAGAIYFAYGQDNPLTRIALPLCVVMIVMFLMRHGIEVRIPLILRRPQDILFMLLYKVQNLKPIYLLALGLLLLENYLITLTPGLPHNSEAMRKIALYLFYLHFVSLSLYRTIILIAHLRERDLVREVLVQTFWKGQVTRSPSIVLEIVHAYFTGILAHMLLIAPWYIVITHASYSAVFLGVTVVLNGVMHAKFKKKGNEWFYRDHWLGHNSELEFVYLHGAHHDAIPCGLIGVSGTGFLEGFVRHVLGHPTVFYGPVMASLVYTFEVASDIKGHQYIPGIFPKSDRVFYESTQHATHHFGRLAPYGIGLRLPAFRGTELARNGAAQKRLMRIPECIGNSIRLDEELNGFVWDNAKYRKLLHLFDKYQK